jgi:hypothetical protein
MALPIINSSRYSTILPSTGQKIEFRPYLVKEEKILMVALESKDQNTIISALKDVIRACVYDDIDTRKMTTFDLESIFMQLRSKSVGETINLKLKCESCSEGNDYVINIEDIEIPKINKDDKTVMITDTVGVVFNYPTLDGIKDYTEDQLKTVEGLSDLIADCMDTIFDDNGVYSAKDETREELLKFIDGLNGSQFQKVTQFFEKIPSLSHSIEYNCKSCGHKNMITLKGIESFFM